MLCVSADDTNLLTAGKKVARHYMSGVAACSQYDVHRVTSMPGLDAGMGGFDATSKSIHVAPDAACREQVEGVGMLTFDSH